MIMMPKPTDKEKKICPYAAIHTLESFSASQLGVKKAFKPSVAPSKNKERTTRTANRTTRTGTNTTVSLPMPLLTFSARTTIENSHTPIITNRMGST